jgi:hypothetical protein
LGDEQEGEGREGSDEQPRDETHGTILWVR